MKAVLSLAIKRITSESQCLEQGAVCVCVWMYTTVHALCMCTVKPLVQVTPNSKTLMLLILSCSCLCPIHWRQVLSQGWRCSWKSAHRRCSNYIWVISNFIGYSGASYNRGLTVYIYIYMCVVLTHNHVFRLTLVGQLHNPLFISCAK